MVEKLGRNLLLCMCIGIHIVCLLFGWKQEAEKSVCRGPGQAWITLHEILSADPLNESEYRTLFYQTGCSRRAIEALPEENREAILLRAQRLFFTRPDTCCSKNSLISWQEENENPVLPDILGIQDGDILISFCSHTFGWRNGHAAIVVDANEGKTLEAVLMGEDSCLQSVEKWRSYPSFVVLRLRHASREKREKIAQYARENLQGIPYGFGTDLLEHFRRKKQEIPEDTDCAHLIWKSYLAFGFDLDSDGGMIVTPRDIAESPLLEVIQIYGMDPAMVVEADELCSFDAPER